MHVATAKGVREYRIFAGVFHLDASLCGRIFRVGLPAGGMSTVESGLFLAVQLLIGTIGVVALSANQIAFTVQGIVFMIPAALGQAATARVGFGLGSGNLAAARRSGLVRPRHERALHGGHGHAHVGKRRRDRVGLPRFGRLGGARP